MEERITKLESEVAELKRKRRDAWDIVHIIGTLLLPIAVAFAGYYYSLTMKDAELAAANQRALADQELARINSRVGQAELVLQYLGELFNSDPKRSDIAAKTIQSALPDFGSSIILSLSQSPPGPDEAGPTQQFLLSALDQRRASLVEALFAPSGGQRNNAYEQLTSREAPWHKDPDVVSGLLNYAWQHMDNANGIYNTVVTLKDLSRAVTQQRKVDINRFCDEAEKQGGRTKEQCDALRKWLDTTR